MRYLNIVGEINELGLESILEKISEFREEELEFIETMLESEEFTREDAVGHAYGYGQLDGLSEDKIWSIYMSGKLMSEDLW